MNRSGCLSSFFTPTTTSDEPTTTAAGGAARALCAAVADDGTLRRGAFERCNVIALPSTGKEGLPNVLLEVRSNAMLCNVMQCNAM